MLISSLQVAPSVASSVFAVCIWLVLIGFLWSLWKALMQGQANLQRLHQIPCYGCTFFTGDYRLKCTVHPDKALSEEALNCLDYEPAVISSSNGSVARNGRLKGHSNRTSSPRVVTVDKMPCV